MVAIARTGNFTRAAQALHVSQPSLRFQIHQLEETLGVRLLDRNTRSVKLTQIGKELTPVVQRLVREIEAVVMNARDLSTGDRGLVSVARPCPPSVPPYCRESSPAFASNLRE